MLVCCLLIHPVKGGDITIVVIAVVSAVEWRRACHDVGMGSEEEEGGCMCVFS